MQIANKIVTVGAQANLQYFPLFNGLLLLTNQQHILTQHPKYKQTA